MTTEDITSSLTHITSKPKYSSAASLAVANVDIDKERGFTSVVLKNDTTSVIGYAKRHLSEDRQNDSIGINRALLDAVKRSCGLKRRIN
jgi:hypothetical protein